MRELDVHKLIEQYDLEAKQRIKEKVYKSCPELMSQTATDEKRKSNNNRKAKGKKKNTTN